MATILIADDLAPNREVLVSLLRHLGHELIEARDGAEALDLVARLRPDLVITDVLMPHLDGFELVRRMRLDPDASRTPVIFYTAHFGEREALDLARSTGVAHVIVKPIDPEDVLRTVSRVLAADEDGPSATTGVPVADDVERDHLRLLTGKLSENVDALRQANARLRALVEVGIELASERNGDRLLDSVATAARELFGATYVTLGIIDRRDQTVARIVSQGTQAELWAPVGSAVPGLLRQVVAERRTIRGENPGGDVAALGLNPAHPPVHAYLAVPVASPAYVYGWMCMAGNDGRAFTLDDEQLARALAGQVGRIYENGHFYAVAERRAEALEHEVRQRQRAEADLRLERDRLQAAEERMRFALESADIGTWDMDYRTGVLQWSPILERQYGVTPGTFDGTFEAFIARIHPDDRESVVARITEATRGGSDFSVEHRVIRPDGGVRQLAGAGRILLDADGRPLRGVGISSDVTERRSLEEQFLQAQKMEAIGRLAGGIAHDFNNVLSVILSYSEMLLEEYDAADPRRADLDQIREAGNRATALTRQLLAFSRQEVIEPALIDLDEVVANVDRMLRPLIREDVDLAVIPGARAGRCRSDRHQIEQVLMNLVVNARDAMPDGGRLTIETANVEFDDEYARVHLGIEPGPYLMLAISDTGIGMDKTTEARIFEPFFTTKPTGKGTGLGLSTVFAIVTRWNGSIRVYSEPGRGTTFKVYFPRVEAAPAVEAVRRAPRIPGGSETILLVEDEEQIRGVAADILRRVGYHVVVAGTPAEAVAACESHTGTIDLLLTDVVMPQMSGRQLADLVAPGRPGMRVLFMSGYTDGALVGQLSPGSGFLQKPFTPGSLTRKVRDLLDGPEAAR